MEFKDLKNHVGQTVTLDGEFFTFGIEGDMGGDWAVLVNEEFYIYATLNYEYRGVPIQIHKIDDGVFAPAPFYVDGFTGEVKDFADYLKIVEIHYRSAKAQDESLCEE